MNQQQQAGVQQAWNAVTPQQTQQQVVQPWNQPAQQQQMGGVMQQQQPQQQMGVMQPQAITGNQMGSQNVMMQPMQQQGQQMGMMSQPSMVQQPMNQQAMNQQPMMMGQGQMMMGNQGMAMGMGQQQGGGGGGGGGTYGPGDNGQGYNKRRFQEDDSDRRSRPRFDSRGGGGGGGRACYNCGDEGHMSRECPQPRQERGGGGGGRRDMGGRDGGGGGRRFPSKDEPPHVEDVVLLFPLDGIGTIIGKGGATIRRIQEESGCNLRLQDPKSVPDGMKERAVILSGSMDTIIEAERLIFEQIAAERQQVQEGPESEKTVKWLVPVEKCGLVIGPKGAGVEEIKQASGAYVRVATKFDMPAGHTERLVTIAGSPEQVERALDMVKDRAGGHPQLPASGWNKGQEATVAGDKEVMFVPLKSIGHILGSHGSEIKRITQESGATVQVSTEMFIGDTERVVTLQGSPESRLRARQLIAERVGTWQQEAGDQAVDTICLKTAIPYCLIGQVLGKGGSAMREISTTCNVSVKINQDMGSFCDTCDNRPVMMIGELEGLYRAQRMMIDRMLDAPRHLKDEATRRLEGGGGDGGGMGGGGGGGGGMQGQMMMMPNGQQVMVVPQGMMQPMMMPNGQMMMMMPQGGGGGMGGGGGGGGRMEEVRRDDSIGIVGSQVHDRGIRLWVIPTCMKYIIGKAGTMIRSISDKSGAEVNAQNQKDMKPGQNGVLIEVQGDPASSNHAYVLIRDTLTSVRDTLDPLGTKRGGGGGGGGGRRY